MEIKEGDVITIDGSTGRIIAGSVSTVKPCRFSRRSLVLMSMRFSHMQNTWGLVLLSMVSICSIISQVCLTLPPFWNRTLRRSFPVPLALYRFTCSYTFLVTIVMPVNVLCLSTSNPVCLGKCCFAKARAPILITIRIHYWTCNGRRRCR